MGNLSAKKIFKKLKAQKAIATATKKSHKNKEGHSNRGSKRTKS
jgi:hypothetical protein